MTAELIVLLSEGEDSRVPIDEILTIGRHPDSHIFLQDELVSRNHALVRREGDDYVILDLGSANGTFVNGQPIAVATPLKSGDLIRLGHSQMRFQSDAAAAPAMQEMDSERFATRRIFTSATMAVLVSDLRNFTPLSETIPGEEMSSLLSQWYRVAGKCIQSNAGIIEQFRGDSVMAYWLADPMAADPNAYVKSAILAAQAMVVASKPFNDLVSNQYPGLEFKIGCGLHMGDAVLGNVGSDARRDFTTMGDCINTAFRIESLCSGLDRQILASELVFQSAGEQFSFEDLGLQTLKGKSLQLRVYALTDGS